MRKWALVGLDGETIAKFKHVGDAWRYALHVARVVGRDKVGIIDLHGHFHNVQPDTDDNVEYVVGKSMARVSERSLPYGVICRSQTEFHPDYGWAKILTPPDSVPILPVFLHNDGTLYRQTVRFTTPSLDGYCATYYVVIGVVLAIIDGQDCTCGNCDRAIYGHAVYAAGDLADKVPGPYCSAMCLDMDLNMPDIKNVS